MNLSLVPNPLSLEISIHVHEFDKFGDAVALNDFFASILDEFLNSGKL